MIIVQAQKAVRMVPGPICMSMGCQAVNRPSFRMICQYACKIVQTNPPNQQKIGNRMTEDTFSYTIQHLCI